MRLRTVGFFVSVSAVAGCATPAPPPQTIEVPTSAVNAIQPPAPQKLLKRKIAVGRFTNETLYGRALLLGNQLDPLGRQTSDMMTARLVDTGRFLVFERPDLNLVKNERAAQGITGAPVGVDTLIVGSLTQFGRATEGEAGFFSNTKRQVARATVEIRLVDVRTGRDFFSATGSGEAATEEGTVMGFGSQADYDSTLNDRAISAAISDVMNVLVSKLEERPWQSDILKVDGNEVYISGGARQGLKPGDRLFVMRPGETVHSSQSGFDIALPPTKVAEIQVEQTFGADETSEGSICTVTSGQVSEQDRAHLIVREAAP